MIQSKNLTKNYGSRCAISNLNFHVKKGEVVGFLGPNGAGKTSTMKILTGYMAPTSGQAFLDGVDVFKDPIAAKKKLGYLPEVPPLYTDMTVRDYITFVAKLKLCPKNKIKGLVDQAIQKTSLGEVQNRLIGNLSKGFKQRTGLAQALVSDPEILILDEPTVGLDPQQVIEIRQTLKSLKGQHTIILSTHVLSEAQKICDRVIIINEGKIVTENSIEDLGEKMNTKKELILKVKKTSDDLITKLKSLEGVTQVEKRHDEIVLDTEPKDDIKDQVAKVVIENSAGLIELKENDFNLEDVFIKLTRKD